MPGEVAGALRMSDAATQRVAAVVGLR